MFTNAMAVNQRRKTIEALLPYVHWIRVSVYHGNEEQADDLKAMAPEKVRLLDRHQFFVLPTEPVDGMLPADCGCKALGMYGDTMDICPPLRCMYLEYGWDLDALPCVKIDRAGFLAPLENIDPLDQAACRYCIGNKKLRPTLRTVENHIR